MKADVRLARDAKKMGKMKDKYKGKRCFIIGNGPSLQMEDLDRLHKNKEYSFGSNRIYLAFSKTKWRPDFFAVSDRIVLANHANEISRVRTKHKFISNRAYFSTNYPKRSSAVIYNLTNKKHYPYCPDFSNDITESIADSYTVTYVMLQIAAYMGFGEIYLLGIDHNYAISKDNSGATIKKDVKSFFIENYHANKNMTPPNLDWGTTGFNKSEIYSRMHGFRIYNATRGGKLESFERVDFDKIDFKY